jgi:predicted cupin superfamily sugar epimerase
MTSAGDWIARLGLQPHPEGGYFRETYRAAESIPAGALPPRFGGPRRFATAIYFLLERGQASVLHRLPADELWHFYDGDALTVYVLEPAGTLVRHRLGRDAAAGETLQAVVPAGCWLGAAVEPPGAFALAGCTVAPGFDFADLEMGARAALVGRYPDHRALIERLTR